MAPLNQQMMTPPAEWNICVFSAVQSTILRKRKTNACTLVARPRCNFITNSQIIIYHFNQLNNHTFFQAKLHHYELNELGNVGINPL